MAMWLAMTTHGWPKTEAGHRPWLSDGRQVYRSQMGPERHPNSELVRKKDISLEKGERRRFNHHPVIETVIENEVPCR